MAAQNADLLRLIVEQQRAHQESLKRLLRAVTVLASDRPSRRVNRVPVRTDVQQYLQAVSRDVGPDWAKAAGAVIIHSASPQPPLLAQLLEGDETHWRQRLRHFSDSQLNPNGVYSSDIYQHVKIQSSADEVPSHTLVQDPPEKPLFTASVERTVPELYAGEIEVTEDLAERFHAPLFVKLFLFVILFDLDLQYLTILTIIFFLHVHGVFEPLMRFLGHRRQDGRQQRNAEPLDRVLQNLQQRRRPEPRTTPDAPSAAPEEPPGGCERVRPSVRLIYQTLVMFFGTMMPWWTPDQRFLV